MSVTTNTNTNLYDPNQATNWSDQDLTQGQSNQNTGGGFYFEEPEVTTNQTIFQRIGVDPTDYGFDEDGVYIGFSSGTSSSSYTSSDSSGGSGSNDYDPSNPPKYSVHPDDDMYYNEEEEEEEVIPPRTGNEMNDSMKENGRIDFNVDGRQYAVVENEDSETGYSAFTVEEDGSLGTMIDEDVQGPNSDLGVNGFYEVGDIPGISSDNRIYVGNSEDPEGEALVVEADAHMESKDGYTGDQLHYIAQWTGTRGTVTETPEGASTAFTSEGYGLPSDPKDMRNDECSQVLLDHFDKAEVRAEGGERDGVLRKDDLQTIAADENSDPYLREAARRVLNDPEYAETLDTKPNSPGRALTKDSLEDSIKEDRAMHNAATRALDEDNFNHLDTRAYGGEADGVISLSDLKVAARDDSDEDLQDAAKELYEYGKKYGIEEFTREDLENFQHQDKLPKQEVVDDRDEIDLIDEKYA